MKETLGSRLRYARELKRYSMGEIAAKTGVSKGTISMAERNVTSLTADNLAKICKALDVTADFIVFGESADRDNEWKKLIATKEGMGIRQAVMNLHKSKKLGEFFSLTNLMTPKQLDLLLTMAKAMLAQSDKSSLGIKDDGELKHS